MTTPDYFEHIKYEARMLEDCYKALKACPKDDTFHQNLYLEGFLLHFRNLLDFFSSEKKNKSKNEEENEADLHYQDDFFKDLNFDQDKINIFQKSIGNNKSGTIRELNKRLAHPTAARTSGYDWEEDQMYALIEPLLSTITNAPHAGNA